MTVTEGELPRLCDSVASCLGLHQHDLGLSEAAMGRRRPVALMRSPARALDRLLVGEHRKLPTDVQTGALAPIQSSVVMGSASG